jgi:hypothetical protein
MKSMPFAMQVSRFLFCAALASVSATTIACGGPSYKVMSPADIQQMGTKQYPQTPEVVFKATAQALETLGYKVTVASPEKGKLKTAPKTIMSTAVASGNRYSAVASSTEDGLGWDITIAANGNGTAVVAAPKAYSNGVDLSDQPSAITQEAVEPHFRTLFRELDSNLK